MENEQYDVLQGQLQALSMVISTILSNQDPLNAAQMAVHLKMSQLEEQALDTENETPPRNSKIRDSLLESYLDLLSAAAKTR